MNLLSYRFLTYLALPLFAYSGWKRCKRHQTRSDDNRNANNTSTPIQHCFSSRFGLNPTSFLQGGIWIHAVSVGETRSVFPLLKQLNNDYPELPITLTNGSTQGAMQSLNFAPVPIQHQMIPYDYPFAVNRFLDQIKPKLVMMVETEIWPNLYQACHERNIPIILINARLKEKSFLAYQKWGGSMLADALNQTHFIAAQFPIDASYFHKLGAESSRIKTLGNLKFDIEIEPTLVEKAANWRAQNTLHNRFIWVAASTHAHPDRTQPSEEELLLDTQQRLFNGRQDDAPVPLLIIAPRHADRFDEVANLLDESGMKWARRSLNEPITAETQVYLADSVGEMMLWFACCQAAFIGGSLVPFGGHNILEPAALHKPVISGPHYQNLKALFETFTDDDALTITENSDGLTAFLMQLLNDPSYAQMRGSQAYQSFKKHSGALDKLMREIKPILD